VLSLLRAKTNLRIDVEPQSGPGESSISEILPRPAFLKMLALERKRSDRSNRPFALMLITSERLLSSVNQAQVVEGISGALAKSTRETDIRGWHGRFTVGVIFTEIGLEPDSSITNAILKKVTQALHSALTPEQVQGIDITLHVYPEQSDNDAPPSVNPPLYSDLAERVSLNLTRLRIKRAMDIAGSLFGLVLFLPLLLIIAILIKLTSRGPILFRQSRVGQFGQTFTFLKFRSMYADNDCTIHKEYVTQLIAKNNGAESFPANGSPVYKISADPRVTPVGKFLRRTSLDELPQFINVLKGEMSLVGPRPPVLYEFHAYKLWHRRRLLDVKPGITGLWQVTGRSRVTFDEMVRLDLQYAQSWSLKLDLLILLQTPRVVLTGQGAY